MNTSCQNPELDLPFQFPNSRRQSQLMKMQFKHDVKLKFGYQLR